MAWKCSEVNTARQAMENLCLGSYKNFFVLGQDEPSAANMSLLFSSAKSSLGFKQCLNEFQQDFWGAIGEKFLVYRLEDCV